MSKKRKYIFILILFILISICIVIYFQTNASTTIEGIDKFPSSYQGYLRELEKKHPNWKFKAIYTNLNWNEVIKQENIFGKNLVPKNYQDRWKNTTSGLYNIEVDRGWVDSSKQAIEYCMDPRNFLNEVRIFQFETLSYDQNTNSIEGIEKILYGTEFYNKAVSYLDNNGNLINTNQKYSDLILKAGQKSSVSPYHLASRIKQEVGPFLTHGSISGVVEGYKGLYNFYNIGATSSAEPMGAIKNGLQYARDGKGADNSTKSKYLIPWDTKEKAIIGGAIFIGSSYINQGQNTIYLQKFDVNDNRSNSLFWHQYMTNVLAPYSESKSIYNGYNNAGLLYTPITFIIPVYNNMPEIPVENPDINPSNYKKDNLTVYCNGTNVNIRSGPGISYEQITYAQDKQKMIRISKGEEWDRVILENGIIGYISNLYISEVNPEPPRELEDSEIKFDSSLVINGLEISGIDYNKNTVLDIRKAITTNLDIEIVNNKNEILSENSEVGTGYKVRIKENGEILREYTIILYGDVNGDSRIDSVDLLVLQRHILEIETFSGAYYKAGNVLRDNKKPTSADMLRIQRHILEIEKIKQK